MFENQTLSILVNMRYPRAWRENIDVAVEKFELEE
jgi:hypothetical protein